MKRLLFLSKVTVLFNILYLIEVGIRLRLIANTTTDKMLPLLGAWMLSPIFNLAFLMSIMLAKKKNTPLPIPTWMWVSSLCFLAYQLIEYLFH